MKSGCESLPFLQSPVAEEPAKGRGEEREEREGGALPALPKKMSIIGVDDNIHPKSLQQAIEEVNGRLYVCIECHAMFCQAVQPIS